MRLARSLTLWLTGTTAVLLSSHGLLQLRKERASLKTAAVRELVLMTTVIRSSVEYAVRDGQQPDITDLLDQIEMRDPSVDVFVFDSEGALLGSSPGSSPKLDLAHEMLRIYQDKPRLQIEDRWPILVAAAPIRAHGSRVGHLVILQPTDALAADLREERRAVILSIAGLVLALSLITWVVVHFRLHRPMSRVIARIRKTAGGDLSSRLDPVGRNEVAELGREFDAMTEALEEARRRLAQEHELRDKLQIDVQRTNKMAAVGQLAASLAHEIGSPMQVLSGRARALATRSDLPEDARRSSEILVEQTDRVANIVERLLDTARVKKPKLTKVDLAEPVLAMVELLEAEARRLNVRLRTELGKVPHVRADPSQVKQVVFNLLQNGCRACQGGGLVRVALVRSSFVLPADLGEQPSVAIVVEDTGPGVPEELMEKIFTPFFTRWENASDHSGTGLGLSVIKSIVSDHGGTVILDQGSGGVGARFTVHFPVWGVAAAPGQGVTK